MRKPSTKPDKTLSGKVRSSLVLKLNVKMTGMMMSAFLIINLFISILFLGVVIWKADEGVQRYINTLGIPQIYEETQNAEGFGYRIQRVDAIGRGVEFPAPLQRIMAIEAEDTRRWITTPGLLPWSGLGHRIRNTYYYAAFTQKGSSYQISYRLESDIKMFATLLLLLVAFEILYLLSSLGSNTKVLRKTLKPLTDLAETAQILQKDMVEAGRYDRGAELKTLAGALGDIDVDRLDRQIAVGSTQHELKDLATAINDMLNRINQSYQTQVRFVSDASHELRTPISVIQGYVNLLDRWGKQDEKVMQESIDAIKSETDNMKNLVEQLLFLARGDNETMQLHRQPFDVCLVVEEIIRETKLIDPHHVFQLRLPATAEIIGDKQLIKQAIRILVDNSIKYTPLGETISLQVAGDSKEIQIRVQDNGIGIPPGDVAYIFDRFYRSDDSRARKTGGAGLGLAIAKWIVERHNGHFQVVSRVDIGTRITVVLPVDEHQSS